EGLPDGIVESGRADLLEVNGIGLAQDVATFLRHLPRDSDGEARAGERVAADEGFRQAELAAELAHFVLEQFPQRLDQSHVHPLREPPHIMVGLYCVALRA